MDISCQPPVVAEVLHDYGEATRRAPRDHLPERSARETAEAQALELGWRLDGTVNLTEAGYLEMVLKKARWLARD